MTPSALRKAGHRWATLVPSRKPFDAVRALRTARAALPRGSAVLAVSDWLDISEEIDRELADLGARFDCTALIARDP